MKRMYLACFNTASGRCCCFITFVFPSLRSGTRDVWASSSLCSSAASHPSSHTASGKCCCNPTQETKQSLSFKSFNTASGKCCCNYVMKDVRNRFNAVVSIPQAVSAVATDWPSLRQTRLW